MKVRIVRRRLSLPLWRIKRWLPAVLAASMGSVAFAQDKPAAVVPAATQPAAPKPVKTVTFSFDGKPWSEVLDWFKQESGLALITTFTPTGSAKILTDPKRKYTISEVVDVLNEGLAGQNCIIVRRVVVRSVSADVPPPSRYPPHVEVEDLKDRAWTNSFS
ncbi:MAG: hypothetical protein U0798_19570 [Gemmataceae bacterium]